MELYILQYIWKKLWNGEVLVEDTKRYFFHYKTILLVPSTSFQNIEKITLRQVEKYLIKKTIHWRDVQWCSAQPQ